MYACTVGMYARMYVFGHLAGLLQRKCEDVGCEDVWVSGSQKSWRWQVAALRVGVERAHH